MSSRTLSFSVLMTVYNQAHDVEEILPTFLEQEYEPGYEVIVVDESSTDEQIPTPLHHLSAQAKQTGCTS